MFKLGPTRMLMQARALPAPYPIRAFPAGRRRATRMSVGGAGGLSPADADLFSALTNVLSVPTGVTSVLQVRSRSRRPRAALRPPRGGASEFSRFRFVHTHLLSSFNEPRPAPHLDLHNQSPTMLNDSVACPSCSRLNFSVSSSSVYLINPICTCFCICPNFLFRS